MLEIIHRICALYHFIQEYINFALNATELLCTERLKYTEAALSIFIFLSIVSPE